MLMYTHINFHLTSFLSKHVQCINNEKNAFAHKHISLKMIYKKKQQRNAVNFVIKTKLQLRPIKIA